ncbi:hypothetical protein QYF36_023197 [Acer negundo]|nr:hypothetical protein QYF36_023197 [Acer negundo]
MLAANSKETSSQILPNDLDQETYSMYSQIRIRMDKSVTIKAKFFKAILEVGHSPLLYRLTAWCTVPRPPIPLRICWLCKGLLAAERSFFGAIPDALLLFLACSALFLFGLLCFALCFGCLLPLVLLLLWPCSVYFYKVVLMC